MPIAPSPMRETSRSASETCCMVPPWLCGRSVPGLILATAPAPPCGGLRVIIDRPVELERARHRVGPGRLHGHDVARRRCRIGVHARPHRRVGDSDHGAVAVVIEDGGGEPLPPRVLEPPPPDAAPEPP